MIRAGRLNQRITITKPGETSRNEIGEPVTTDVTVATVWAAVIDSKAVDTDSQTIQAARQGTPKTQTEILFLIRFRSDIDNTCKIIYSGKTFGVVNIHNKYGKNSELEITARG